MAHHNNAGLFGFNFERCSKCMAKRINKRSHRVYLRSGLPLPVRPRIGGARVDNVYLSAMPWVFVSVAGPFRTRAQCRLETHVPVTRRTVCAPPPILKSLTIKSISSLSNGDLTVFDLAHGTLIPIITAAKRPRLHPVPPTQCMHLDGRVLITCAGSCRKHAG